MGARTAAMIAMGLTVLGIGLGTVEAASHHRKLSLIDERHSQPYEEKSADSSYPKSDFSALMQSPCRPEESGYFGATMGLPKILQYGFEMETSVQAEIDKVLDIIDEHVMDSVLVHTFPNVCGYRRRLNPNIDEPVRVTGFHFSKEMIDMNRPCQPEMLSTNYCGVYTSAISVFGHDLEPGDTAVLLDTISGAVPDSLDLASQKGVVRLNITATLTKQINGQNENGGELKAGGKAGLILLSLCLVTGIVALFIFLRRDQRDHLHSPSVNKGHRLLNKRELEMRKIMQYFASGNGTERDNISACDKTSLGSYSLTLERGRPTFVEFNPYLNISEDISDVERISERFSNGDDELPDELYLHEFVDQTQLRGLD